MHRFFRATPAAAVLALAAAAFLHLRIAAQPKPEPAQHSHVTIEQVNRWETELSNWGGWGQADERGALNLITAQKEIQAARLVKDGMTVSLAHFADLQKAADNFNFGPTKHEMFHNPETGKIGGALDIITFGIHDGTNSHLDALCHYRLDRDGKLLVFNGHPQDLDESGCKANAIDRMGPGIFTRGILVDLPLLKGVPYLDPGTPIYASDLEAWEKYAGVKIGSGDVLLVRTGRWARRAKLGPWDAPREAARPHSSVAPLRRHRDIFLLGPRCA